MLKNALVLCLLFFVALGAFAQQPDSTRGLPDSTKRADSILVKDSSTVAKDSLQAVSPTVTPKQYPLNKILADNIYLNSKGKPSTFIQSVRKVNSKDGIFYALALLVFLFAILKFLYARYFSNLFRVFFNTSLRQGQLTDQLLQAKLPSLLYNIFFILVGGWYIYLLLHFFGKTGNSIRWDVFSTCVLGLAIIYVAKFMILKFTGWLTGFQQEADTYIFIVFLINKIVAICLVPLVIIMAFSEKKLVDIAILLSFIVSGGMILMRFIRSYSLLQNRLKVSRFHFFVYIAGIEIVPLLVIYKVALIFMSKNL